MRGGYIKLWRKVGDSSLWQDLNAWRVFEWLLLNVDYKTGIGTFGRAQIARATGLKDNTVYKVTGRLHEKYQVINIKSNNKFTEFSVTNWAKYQQDIDEVTGSVHEKEQERPRNVTLYKEERNKNKEYIRESNSVQYLLKIPLSDISLFHEKFQCSTEQITSKGEDLYNYCKAKGKKYSDYKAFLRNALMKDFGVRRKTPVFSPNLPELTEEQRLANIERLNIMRKQVFKN
ncbi:MAG: hypothetical protein QG639_260 [Patescibacteria group bacterium]|nr:hypothetical protein [Patescibacteria group bacterium]